MRLARTARDERRREELGGDEVLDLLLLGEAAQLAVVDGDEIDDGVEPPERLRGTLREAHGGLGVGKRPAVELDLGRALREHGAERGDLGRVLVGLEHELRTVLGEGAGDVDAETRGEPGDEDTRAG